MELLTPQVHTTYIVFCEEASGFTYEVASYGTFGAAENVRDGIIQGQVDCYPNGNPRIAYVYVVTKQTIEQFVSKDLRSVLVAMAEKAVEEVAE